MLIKTKFENYDDGLVANFVRLLKDAELLNNHGRYASAYALAIIGLEEIAKVILSRWDHFQVKFPLAKRRNQHLTKQAALACLLVAEHMAPSYDLIIAGDPNFRRAFIKLPSIETDTALMWRVHNEEIQHAKHLALYHDNNVGEAGSVRQFTRVEVEELFAYARRVVMLTADYKALLIGFSLFQAIKGYDQINNTWAL